MSFTSDIHTFTETVKTRTQTVFVNTVSEAKRSITDGSEVTGAPGQPVDTGNLKNSWILEFESPTSALISTNVVYAPEIEDGVTSARSGNVTGHTQQQLVLRSQVGGFHSVALTRAGLSRIVDVETAKVAK